MLITRPFPQTEGTIVVEGLTAPVTIRRNADGVPAITAATTEDLFFAQGFVHAQDRLFEMDVQRRENQSIKGEVARTRATATDLLRLDSAEAQSIAILEAYSAGVNGYVATASALPIEYQWLGMEWEAWHPQDSLVILEHYAQGVRATDAYHRRWRLSASQTDNQEQRLVQVLYQPTPLRNPWYANRLESPAYQASGLSLMGVPFIVTGANGEIAWMWHRVQRCPEAAPFSPSPSALLTTACDVNVVSWFTMALGYNQNNPMANPLSDNPPPPTKWIDSRINGSASQQIVSLFGRPTAEGIALLRQEEEEDVADWVEMLLAAAPSDNIIIQRAQSQLAAWDQTMEPALPGAALYRVLRAFTFREMLIDEIEEEEVMDVLQARDSNGTGAYFSASYDELWDDIGTPEIESRDEIITRAWKEAHLYLGRRFGDVPHEWAWGRLHYATFRHPLADQLPILDSLLTYTVPLGGSATTTIPIPDNPADDFKPAALPSLYAFVSPGGDFYFAYPGGQSTHPFHPQSNRFLEAWSTGDLIKLEWNGQHEAVLKLIIDN